MTTNNANRGLRGLLLCGAIIFLALFLPAAVRAEGVAVKGMVTTSGGAPMGGITVVLDGVGRYTTTTRRDGAFAFHAVRSGDYVLAARCVGYREHRQRIEVREGNVEIALALAEMPVRTPEITVTASRSPRGVEGSAAAVEVIANEEIENTRPRYLGDLLAERVGLSIIDDHGTGVQVQGLDPQYTLILIDGNPVIGRTAGTIDLDRIMMDNVEKVEIVRGPTSSLYGSDALAGVINVITRVPDTAFHGVARAGYGANGTLNVAAGGSLAAGPLAFSLDARSLSSSGYDLTPATVARTVAPFTTWGLRPQVRYGLDESTVLVLSGDLNRSFQEGPNQVAEGSDTLRVTDRSTRTDWNVAQSLRHRLSGDLAVEQKVVVTRYGTEQVLDAGGSEYGRSEFDQLQVMAEVETDATLAEHDILTAGAGYISESVEAERIAGGRRGASSLYLFAQNEWTPDPAFNVTTGIRYDHHNEYGDRFSPKAAVLYRPLDRLAIRGAVGTGFKAPTFQQLHLDFTNPTVGYSVVGSTGAAEELAELEASGHVQERLIDLRGGYDLRPEKSIGYNLGLDLELMEDLTLSANSFINDIRDMIETAPVALKDNGQHLYTYFNLNNVVSRGAEGELRFTGIDSFTVSVGYALLDAYDVSSRDAVERGEVTKVGATGRIRPVQMSEFGGLFNRSRHSGCARLTYENGGLGLTASLRGVYRGEYGYSDRNANGVLDDASEYAPGYDLWNITLTQRVTDGITLHGSIDNIFDRRSLYVPSMPGRLMEIGVTVARR